MAKWEQHVTGLSDFMAVFETLSVEVKNEITDKALAKAGKLLEAEVESRAPVLTGQLKGRIEIKLLPAVQDGHIKAVLVGARVVKGKRFGGTAVDEGYRSTKRSEGEPYYILFIERGWFQGKRHTRSRMATHEETHGGHKYIAPKPFAQPAFDAIAPQIPDIFKNEMQRVLARLQKKQKKSA